MLDAPTLFLSFPGFKGVIIEELFHMDVVLAPKVESSLLPNNFDPFLLEAVYVLTLNIHSEVVVKIINIVAKDPKD
jgi:hypothetical protein